MTPLVEEGDALGEAATMQLAFVAVPEHAVRRFLLSSVGITVTPL